MKLPRYMEELILCLTQQDLNEYPYWINLQEYLRLQEIAKEKSK